jgi:hypothetical protein
VKTSTCELRDCDFASDDTRRRGDVERENFNAQRGEGGELGDRASCGDYSKASSVKGEREVMA